MRTMNNNGMLIVFEGGNGSGKSLQARMLAQRLGEEGVPCTTIREPGSTRLGEYLRNYLKEDEEVSPYAETLLFAAARAQLIDQTIMPALDKGVSIIADRFTASSIAYQGYGRGVGARPVAEINRHATRDLKPNMVFLLDIDPVLGLERSALARGNSPAREGARFEELDLEFHQKVREGYLFSARNDPLTWRILDATQPIEELGEQIAQEIMTVVRSQWSGASD